MSSIQQDIELAAIKAFVAWVNETTKPEADTFIGKEAGYGEADVVAYANKISPALGAVASAAVAAAWRRPARPFEGDATAWLVAVLTPPTKRSSRVHRPVHSG